MKIVVTDGYTVNPGDLGWESIAAFGELSVYERTPPELLLERCHEAGIILCNKVPLNRENLEKLPALRMIGVMATGYNVVDTVAAREKNIIVCNVPAYGTASVAQHTIALLLELTNQAGKHWDSVLAGEWVRSKDWSYAKTALIELEGKTLGIVGFGHIGMRTAGIAKGLGMEICYYSRTRKETTLAEYCPLETLFSKSDVVSLHCPLQPDNLAFVNRELIQKMKRSAFLINTARGQLIAEQDLADALNNGLIAGAALDVLSAEPPQSDNPLLSAKNCIITPHNAWMSREARQRILTITADNINSFLQKNPVHVVN
ncbi:MAG TPA: D-2-hydroxyacid dehydrogenase [Puia sp.]|nr:D-2-hydroxyacid dehydrogenase [Puia sp.]